MTFDALSKLWETESKTPEGTVRIYLLAMLEHLQTGDEELKRAVGLCLPKDELDEAGIPIGASQRLAFSQFGREIHGTKVVGAIAASYLGGTPKNGYQPDPNAKLTVREGLCHRSEKETKLFVQSGGKDSPTPVQLKRNQEGHWKIFDATSLFTGVRPAESDDF
jgi:hypothetical protein